VGFLGGGFLGGCTQKKPTGFFWVRTRVSEPWSRCTELLMPTELHQTADSRSSDMAMASSFTPHI